MTVYFVRREGAVKIGTSRDVRSRIKAFKGGTLIGHVPGGVAVERALHHEFKPLRLEGEWFRCAGRLREFIESGLDVPYGFFDENSEFVGLLGRGFERSFYRAYARTKGGPWWRFELEQWPSTYDPVERQRTVRGPAETVYCALHEVVDYEGKPDNPALLRLLRRAATLRASRQYPVLQFGAVNSFVGTKDFASCAPVLRGVV